MTKLLHAWPAILAVLTTIVALGTVAVRRLDTEGDKPETWWHIFVDIVAAMPKPGMVGVTGSPTWNLPGFRSQEPVQPRSSAQKGSIRSGVLFALAVAAELVLVVLVASCAITKSIAIDSAQCVADRLPAALADLAQQAEDSILRADAQSWEKFAAGELLTRGKPAAICVVQAIVHRLDLRLPPKLASGGEPPSEALREAHRRAVEWLETHDVKHVEPER
jgi:hypothetical protein